MNQVDNANTAYNWFVLRDLKRPNAKEPAYKYLADRGFEVFTPMKTQVVEQGGRRIRREVPFIQDLLFVFSTRAALDSEVNRCDTLQYRFVKGQAYGTAMTVPPADMARFITATRAVKTPQYYQLDEITPAMCGARIRMICEGALNGFEGYLLKVKGSRKRRLIVKLPGLLAAAIEVAEADYIELI